MSTPTMDRAVLQIDFTPADGLAAEPDWLRELRAVGRARFDVLGVPTARHEEWRTTSLRPLTSTAFGRPPAKAPALDPRRLDERTLDLDGPRLVFANGRWAPALSRLRDLPGVTIVRFAEAEGAAAAALEANLGRVADLEREAFSALNTASLDDGVLVLVDDRVECDVPITVVHATAPEDGPLATHPRLLIVAGRESRVTVVEEHVGLDDADVYFTNAVTEIACGPGADVRHYLLERESRAAFNISTLDARQERDSRLASHTILLGGRLVRNNVHPVLAGPGGHGLVNGLFIGGAGQTLDNHMRVEHAAPHCDSRQYYKGILADDAHGVFSGRIVVAEGAQKTDAVQSNSNLLLSGAARMNTKPQLEIYADDVKCTHGATIGEMDEQAIFYLRSRGLSEADARGLLIESFARESLERMECEPLRGALERLLLPRLPRGTAAGTAAG